MSIEINRPEYGKQYALTGATGKKCIMNGNSWAESEIKNVSPTGRCICGCHEIIRREKGCPECKDNHRN